MKPTHKQIQYLAYKLQEYGAVPSDDSDMYWTYENRTTDKAIALVDKEWQRVFGSSIHDLNISEMKGILQLFAPAYFESQKARRQRFLNKFNKENENE